jgi:hypothetical protein
MSAPTVQTHLADIGATVVVYVGRSGPAERNERHSQETVQTLLRGAVWQLLAVLG